MRKKRGKIRDTFCIRVSDGGSVVSDQVRPVFFRKNFPEHLHFRIRVVSYE